MVQPTGKGFLIIYHTLCGHIPNTETLAGLRFPRSRQK
jgi:hypothetical protein